MIKRYDLQDHNITTYDLAQCKAQMPKELINIAESKMFYIIGCIPNMDYAQQAMFKDSFILGYLAAHCINNEQKRVEERLTPLGIALSENE